MVPVSNVAWKFAPVSASALSGMKLRRVFDRAPAEARAMPSHEAIGPFR